MKGLPSIFRRGDAETSKDVAATARALGLPATVPPPSPPRRASLVVAEPALAAAAPVRADDIARLVLAVDATWSRSSAWEASQRVMDALFRALPGELLVSLAVHGGGEVHTFTDFLPDVGALRRKAARIECQAGRTALLEILSRVLDADPARVILYVGDVFEESLSEADRLAEELAARDTSVIILHDRAKLTAGQARAADAVFERMASMTGGAVLPFDASALDELRAMLEAVSVLAVGGTAMVEAKQADLPAAPLLLERIADSKQFLIGTTKR